jgi:hypothetical protein
MELKKELTKNGEGIGEDTMAKVKWTGEGIGEWTKKIRT